MTRRLSGLFSVGENFDDEDLLGTDWCARSDVAAAVSLVSQQASSSSSSAAHRERGKNCLQQTGGRSVASSNGSGSRSGTHATAGPTVGLSLRQLCSSSSSSAPAQPPTKSISPPKVESQKSNPKPQDDFDDWDMDLADLKECDFQVGHPPLPPPPTTAPAPTVSPVSSAKTLRPPTCRGIQTQPNQILREIKSPHPAFGSSNTPQTPSAPVLSPQTHQPLFTDAPFQSPTVFPGFTATSSTPCPLQRTLPRPQLHPQKPLTTMGPSLQPRGLFETVSPAPSSTSSSSHFPMCPHPLHTPVLTNRLVQLVSASNKLPGKRPCSEPHRPRTRRFPGPAGLLPQQPQGHSMDEIVVSVPVTPAHGTVARLPSQGSSSQAEEDDFSGRAWAAMKAEMGLDERNSSCFLHTYSIVMVLRKAALKQLSKNKVPNMAVMLKSIIHTHADAKAVFKDPTGEIQGTVHRRLLEDRAEDLKVGAVLLLKQVGVFSPSHRNHYLNVTPNNLLRIYAQDGVGVSSTQLPPLVLVPLSPAPAMCSRVLRETVSHMHLVFDEEEDDDERQEEGWCMERGGAHPQTSRDTRAGSSRGPREAAGKATPQELDWDADDDLNELLGELPEDTYSL